MDKKKTVLDFIFEELLDGDDINYETSLFKDNILDSLNLLSLVSFLEKTFNIKINASEINYENLDSIENIANFLSKKTA